MKSSSCFTVACALLLLAACGTGETFHTYRADRRTASLDASQRLVLSVPVRSGMDDRGRDKAVDLSSPRHFPSRIVCAEPSPDVAVAVAQTLSASIEAAAEKTGKAGAGGEAAAQYASQLSRAALQMTERTQTIQLLRDILYRACEAYMNGALTRTSYALILGRFDTMATTMHISELAAGAFGRNLGTIGTNTAAPGIPVSLLSGNRGDGRINGGDAAEPKGGDPAAGTGSGSDNVLSALKVAETKPNPISTGSVKPGEQVSRSGGELDFDSSPEMADRLALILTSYLDHAENSAASTITACIATFEEDAIKVSNGQSEYSQVCRDIFYRVWTKFTQTTERSPTKTEGFAKASEMLTVQDNIRTLRDNCLPTATNGWTSAQCKAFQELLIQGLSNRSK